MMKNTVRTMSTAALAGSMVLGMSACTKVEGSASKATSAGASAASSATSQPTQSSDTSSPTSDTATSDTATSDTATDSGSDSGSGPKTGKVGEEVKTNAMSVKVSKISDPIQPESDYDKPDSGKHFIAVNVSITNLGSKDLNAGDTCLKVRLDDNTSAKSDYAQYGQRLDYGTLYKGDTTTGDVVYQVPNGKKVKTIDVDCSYGDEQAVRITAN